ncbi:hypothetical protein [Saliphagus sp. LR7]|nr:hypothetical protein [Saliphagus sp. LR7]
MDQPGDVDAAGWYTADAVFGAYDLTVRANGRTATAAVALADPR